MKNLGGLLRHLFLLAVIIILDRVSKLYVLYRARVVIEAKVRMLPFFIRKFISIDRVVNRGISWGLLSKQSRYVFSFLTITILAIIFGLCIYSYRRYKRGHAIIGEIFVIGGAISNVIDRFLYGGVIDFINFSIGPWAFPATFNIADIFIVVGVGIMFIQHYLYE